MKPTLQINDVGMTFATKRGPFVALRDISLDVQRGEFVTLIGRTRPSCANAHWPRLSWWAWRMRWPSARTRSPAA